MLILGLDPGLAYTGFAVLRSSDHDLSLVRMGAIRTSSRARLPQRLHVLYVGICRLFEESRPDMAGMEDVFSSARYPKAGLTLAQVAGVILLAAEMHKVPIVEIPAREIRSSLVGYGNAKKEQIREAVKRVLRLDWTGSYHEADALAVALVLHYRGPLRLRDDILSLRTAKIHK